MRIFELHGMLVGYPIALQTGIIHFQLFRMDLALRGGAVEQRILQL